MSTIFTKIANKEIPSYTIAENDDFYAFLDISPLTKGHTLVIPKKTEEDYLFNLKDDTYSELMTFAKKVAEGIKKATDCKRVGVAVIGMEVPHTHIHLIPINKETDMVFTNPKLELSQEEMSNIAEMIRTEIKL